MQLLFIALHRPWLIKHPDSQHDVTRESAVRLRTEKEFVRVQEERRNYCLDCIDDWSLYWILILIQEQLYNQQILNNCDLRTIVDNDELLDNRLGSIFSITYHI